MPSRLPAATPAPAPDAPSVPAQWAPDKAVMCAPSLPIPSAVLASMPIPPSRTSARNKDPHHIPRPRNAFMLFRSAFAAQKITASVEHDNRHITRIIAHCWNRLSDDEKQIWRDKAALEKAQHAERYPNYRFSPTGRTNKRTKRNVRRNGADDVKRCEKLAELVMSGKHGRDLEHAIKGIDDEQSSARRAADISPGTSATTTPVDNVVSPINLEPVDVPPFRSPLLPPSDTTSQQIHASQLLTSVTTTPYLEPQASYVLDNACMQHGVLDSLFKPQSCDHHRPMNLHDYAPSPRSIPPLDQFQPMMQFAHHQTGQSLPDFTLTPYSWNQSGSFSYYQ